MANLQSVATKTTNGGTLAMLPLFFSATALFMNVWYFSCVDSWLCLEYTVHVRKN